MRSIILLLFSILIGYAAASQIVITPGAQLYMSGNAQLTLHNSSFQNNGSFVASNGTVTFTGSAGSSITGNQPIQFYQLQIFKDTGSSVSLQTSISVSHRVVFTSGFINLGNSALNLGTTAYLHGESEISRITTNGSGYVQFDTVLNAPAAVNPANLGAVITSNQNLGNVTIRRGHQVQTNASGVGSSIRRTYDISPSNASNPGATLRLHYFDGELNGIDENILSLYANTDGTNWVPQSFTTRNKTENWVEKTGVGALRLFTLSGLGNALPLQFKLFNVKCDGGKTIIQWKTAQEQNTQRFDIQKSTDGLQWSVLGSIPAAGNSADEKSYAFTDNNASQNNYYRIAAYDVDGKIHYTSIIRSSCASADVFKLWPNPAIRNVFINITATVASEAVVRVYDSRGALQKQQRQQVLAGANQFTIDLGNLASGIYSVQVEWNNGQMKQAIQVIKK